jgi:glycerophosphoryl diester phosphodiesterase
VTHPWFVGSGTPRVLAHRGLVTADAEADGVAENSFMAIAAAHAAGAVYVESDCHLTRDGVVVLFHDTDLRRVAADPRRLAEVTAAQLESLMASRGGLVTLEEALAAFPSVRFNLDVKADAAAESVGRIVAPHGARVLVTSFSDARRITALGAAARAGAEVLPATSAGRGTIARLLAAVTARSHRLAASALRGIDALQVPERQRALRIVTPRMIDAAHRLGVEVHVWTINDPDAMRRLVAMGVDGIVTDRADIALSTLARTRPA